VVLTKNNSGYTLATPTGIYLGQTSCASDVDYATMSITATVCAADSEPTETVFAAGNEAGVVWAKRILVVMDDDDDDDDDEESSESSVLRSSSTRISRTTVTASESESETESATAEETSQEETGGVVGVTSRLPSASPTANAAGRIDGFAGVLVGLMAVMFVVV
jgi:hypothetical protein